ncbi:cyclophilin peptidyl-prolyl cis-trans isomerase Cyp8 [Oleoguttula sp. CCFEE 5521]
MGKGTDKLYITHSEWSSADAFGASAGANARKADPSNRNNLPFTHCALTLTPWSHPVCTPGGRIFELTGILPHVRKHGTDPVDNSPLKTSELVKLNFTKSEGKEGGFVDPVTDKSFTASTRLVAIKGTGNVFAWETVERLNIKAKNWRDLVSEVEFERGDVVVLQEGEGRVTGGGGKEEENEKVRKAKEAVAKKRAERESGSTAVSTTSASTMARPAASAASSRTTAALPYNAARHSNGLAAASFTSTGLTPNTSTAPTLLTTEQYLLSRPRLVKNTGYARLLTTHGTLNLALYPENAPKAVWNFITLAKRGYYNGVSFHRNIPSFMLQGGDPTGTGRGGESCWGKEKAFADEFEGPLKHDGRGVVSMANKGKGTNTSQFFFTYRAAPHLDRKHTIFGRVVEGLDTLDRLEKVPVDEKDRPTERCAIEGVVIFVDPFEEFLKEREGKEVEDLRKEVLRKEGGAEDERTTWTGKRVRGDGKAGEDGGGVGKYLKAAGEGLKAKVVGEEWEGGETMAPLVKKAKKGGGFGDFSGW